MRYKVDASMVFDGQDIWFANRVGHSNRSDRVSPR